MNEQLLNDYDLKKKKSSCGSSPDSMYFPCVIISVFSAAIFISLLLNMIFVGGMQIGIGSKFVKLPDPPPHGEVAKVARYVMHISNWGSLSTISTHEGIETYPFVNVFSVSDGPVSNSSGVPYFYFTELELSLKDISKDNRVSFTISENQSNYCKIKGFDPEDPRCAHIIFTGRIVKITKGSDEEAFARQSLFSRHSEMPEWPKDHNWFFAKLDIIHIYVLDYFGGAKTVDVAKYFKSNPF